MATKLGLFNRALLLLGERSLSAVDEDRNPRHALDEVYDSTLLDCLEAGLWNFALKRDSISADATDPTFGYTSRFAVPSDWVRTSAISLSETFHPTLLDYVQEAGYWQANAEKIYVLYVSSDASYGLDLTAWTPAFTRFVEASLAFEICERLTQNASKMEALLKLKSRRLYLASSKDVSNEAARFKPAGSWVRSRSGGRGVLHRHTAGSLS